MEELKQKKYLLQEEINDKGYDTTNFINFCITEKEDGDDLNNWTLEELKKIIAKFQSIEDQGKETSKELEDFFQEYSLPEKDLLQELSKDSNFYKLILRIYIQQDGYLDNKNIYLILYFMGKKEVIKYKKYRQYEIKFEIEKKDLLTFYKTPINVCIYELGLIKEKYKGDFDIQLSDLKTKSDFSQECEIHLENKEKGVYSTVLIKSQPQYKNINLNKKNNNNNINKIPGNKPIQTISKPKIEEKHLNINIKKEDVIELNKKIDELKNLLNEKEKIIAEGNNKNHKLNEELSKTQNLLKEKEKAIEKEKNQNQILGKELSKSQNLLKEKEKILEEEINKNKNLIKKLKDLQNSLKVQEEESNKKINNYQSIISTDSKDEKMIKLLDELELKEKEIKKLNEMKSRFPFELLENEKLMTLIIISGDQKVHYSIICKNTLKFTEIEHNLYEKYPEYLESENYFLAGGKKINKYKSLEENNIKNSDIITLYKFDE